MKSKFLNLKEFVLVLLLACLETVIGLVAAMPLQQIFNWYIFSFRDLRA